MEEQSCVLLENGRRISAFASLLPFMRGTALTPDPGIKNRQAPCGACRFLSEDYRKDVLAILADGFELLQNIYISKVNYVLLSTKLFSHFLHIIDIDCYSFNQITCFFFRYGT